MDQLQKSQMELKCRLTQTIDELEKNLESALENKAAAEARQSDTKVMRLSDIEAVSADLLMSIL